MWKRKEIKKQGKAAFKANYWRCVLVTLILLAITGSGSGVTGHMTGAVAGSTAGGSTVGLATQYITSVESTVPADLPADAAVNDPADASAGKTIEFPATGNADLDEVLDSLAEDPSFSAAMEQLFNDPQTSGLMEQLSQMDWESIMIVLAIVGIVLLVVLVLAFLLKLLIINPLSVGCRYFFAHNAREKAPLGDLAEGFESGYGRVVKTMFLKDLFLFFWTLLLIIPGIIKSYSYRMVPYILADQPDLGGTAAIRRSREMMKGNKWRTFVLDLSFILWWILSILTLGILGVFYVNPYYQSANGALYQALKAKDSAGMLSEFE